jgi:hypothetical protein
LIVCEQEAVLSQASVDCQVREIFLAWGHEPAVTASAWIIEGFSVQMSAAMAVPVFDGSADALHSMDLSGGHVMVGGMVSLILTLTESVSKSPPLSVTVNDTVQLIIQPDDASMVKIGLASVALLKSPPGQSVIQEYCSGNPSGSLEPAPSN